MKLTLKKVKELRDSANEKKKALHMEFIIAVGVVQQTDNWEYVNKIGKYNFWTGYSYAMEKIEQYMRFKK